MKKILYISAALIVSAMTYDNVAAQVAKKDSLNRELTLERDFVPTQNQIQKSFFSPLSGQKKSALTPLKFVNDSYALSTKIETRSFDPIFNDRAPESEPQKGFIRLFGGWQGYGGLNAGASFVNEQKSQTDMSINHFTRYILGRNTLPAPIKRARTHDTDATLSYAKKLSLGTLRLRGHAFYDVEGIYGSDNRLESPLNLAEQDFKPTYPTLSNYGAVLSGERTYAPLSAGSQWFGSTQGSISFTSKNDFVLASKIPEETYSGTDLMTTRELRIANQSSVSYEFSDLIKAGADAEIDLRQYPTLVGEYPVGNMTLLGVRPVVSFKGNTFDIHIGGKVQYVNTASKSLLLSSDIALRFHPVDAFSMFAKLDGGASLPTLRDTYLINKYFIAPSIINATEAVRYRAILGVEMGPFSGLSLTLRGGYADYQDFADWQQKILKVDMVKDTTLPISMYALRQRNDVKKTYGEIMAKYISHTGLKLSAAFRYNHYVTSDLKDKEGVDISVQGLPKYELNASATYDISRRLSVQATFTGLGGIQTEDRRSEGKVERTMFNELNAGISYRASKRVGLSLTGINLLNGKNERWRHYEHRGLGIMGAATFTF
ncbi:hypothetical protein [Porphyromonas sp.]|uniref:hypothetical protein n=1 Tax=Porphyromonas sp. TaxID=1924944 RepID=UPI0026DC67FF|nr:hypothetical protein [Porphyromonas sp.]MDO4771373.1 hypothetical protein [Porphyromonas sp.]